MKKLSVLKTLSKTGVVAVVRADSPEEALDMSRACVAGGVTNIEIAYTTPGASEAIQQLAEEYKNDENVVIGAGTVLDSVTARLAILAGAQFVVSPAFDGEVAKICNLYRIPYMPGCLTISEIQEALQYGVDVIKLFPGSGFGPSFIKAVKGPLPQVNIMPTGGVNLDNVQEWIKNGAFAVGVGGNLVNAARDDQDYSKVTNLAREYIEKVKEVRGS